jgi:arabinogalactan endo-1,4-beta-galactosidase
MFAATLLALTALALTSRAEFMKGGDLSLLQFIQDHGVEYKETNQVKDPLLIFKDHGFNTVRLRLFVAPNGKAGQVNSLSYTLRLAKRVKDAGLKLMLDFHYSDGWADPAHQIIPAEWKELSHAQLVDRVFAYTRETMAAFARECCTPDMVAVGNEISNGMMWPDGGPLSDAAKWDTLADLLKAGIRGVRASDPKGVVRVMIHIDKGGDKKASRWFYDNLQSRGVSFDVIGLSYYPFWHGTLANLSENLASLSESYKKDIMVVETGYDTWGGPQEKLPFPITPGGQKAFLEELIRVVAATPDGHGQGVVYWAPEWIMGAKWNASGSGAWESRALFDNSGNMRPAMNAFQWTEPDRR